MKFAQLLTPFKTKTKNKHFYVILSGSFWAFLLKVVAMFFSYVSTLLISNYFGPRTVGLFNLSYAIISIITLISLMGFPTAILRFTGEFRNDRALAIILKKMVFLSFTISLFFVLGFLPFADYVSTKLFHDQRLKDFLCIMLLGTPLVIVYTIFIEFIRGLGLVKISETIRNSISIFKLFFILLLIFVLKCNDLTPAIANISATILVFLIALVYTIKKLRQLQFTKVTSVSYRKILNISFPMLVTASMFMIMSLTDKLMLGIFKTPYEVGIYSVALKLATITSMVLTAINTIVAPKFSELYWEYNLEDLKKVIRFSAKIIFFSSAPILLIYFLFSHQILSIFGKEFVQGASALIILSVGQFINSASGSVGYFLNMTGHQKVFRNIVFISSFVNIVLNYLLIPILGYNGAAFATAFSISLWNIMALVYAKIKFKLFMGYLPFITKEII